MDISDTLYNGVESEEDFLIPSHDEFPQNSETQITEPTKLNFVESPIPPELVKKAEEIEKYLKSGSVTAAKLKEYALSKGGLVTDTARRTGWPGLLGLEPGSAEPAPDEKSLRAHPEFGQVVLDVNRSIKRFPPGIPYERRVALQEQLTNLILRVITKYPHLRYYQGYHDVAITILLVVGEPMAFMIMERLSTEHLRDCMEPTMEKTSYLLNYIFPLINRISPQLCSHIDNSGAGTMFCLPWFLTWFGHSLNHYKDVVRLYDFFLASPPLMSLYLTVVIVVHRETEILATDPNMASIHCLLSRLPDDLPFEELIVDAIRLYDEYPPEKAESEVKARIIKEKEERDKEIAARLVARRNARYRGIRNQIQRYLPRSKAQLFLLAVSVAMGLYAYLKANSPVR